MPILVSVWKTETKMGTYTTNYNLFLPSIGEQGWGELVNGNFITIDTTMKGLDTRMGTAETNVTSLTTRMGTAETTINSNKSRIGTLETETDAIDARVTKLENGEFSGNVSGNKFYGARVGTFTFTSPNTWSIANTVNYSYSHRPSDGGGKSSEFTPDRTALYSWDEIIDINDVTYNFVYTYGGDYAWTSLVITFTNILTNESTEHTISVGKSNKTFTLTAPVFSKIKTSTSMTSIWNNHTACSLTVSRPDIYFTHA